MLNNNVSYLSESFSFACWLAFACIAHVSSGLSAAVEALKTMFCKKKIKTKHSSCCLQPTRPEYQHGDCELPHPSHPVLCPRTHGQRGEAVLCIHVQSQ